MNTATASDDAIVSEVTIEAPAERIFNALTNPEELLQWWRAEEKFEVVHAESDLRPGGKWKMRVAGCGGTVSTVSGHYRQIERPHLLVYSWIREQDDAPETLVRWDLLEKEGVTRVRVTHSGLTSKSLRARNSGWPLVVDLLQAYVENKIASIPGKPGGESLIQFLCSEKGKR